VINSTRKYSAVGRGLWRRLRVDGGARQCFWMLPNKETACTNHRDALGWDLISDLTRSASRRCRVVDHRLRSGRHRRQRSNIPTQSARQADAALAWDPRRTCSGRHCRAISLRTRAPPAELIHQCFGILRRAGSCRVRPERRHHKPGVALQFGIAARTRALQKTRRRPLRCSGGSAA